MDNMIIELLLENNESLKELYFLLDKYNLRDMLIDYFKSAKKEELYPSAFHGLHHSQKVTILAAVLAKINGFKDEELKLILDAAFYHDIGRINDYEESSHGMIGAVKILDIIDKTDEVYSKPGYIGYIRAIVDAHSVPISNAKNNIFEYYFEDYPNMEFEIYEKMFNVLLDSDALDRTRFCKTSKACLDKNYLRLEASHDLIMVSKALNQALFNKLDNYNIKLIEKQLEKNEIKKLYHGIGYNFFAIEDIMKHGILSHYEATKKNIDFVSNFNDNNNGRLWVSAVEKDPINEGKAYTNFIMDKIHFGFEVDHWASTMVTKKSQSKDTGFALDSGEYSDEHFVFLEIKPNSIGEINLGDEDRPVNTLSYLGCSKNYDVILNKVNYYVSKIYKKLGYSVDKTEADPILGEYIECVLKYDRLSITQQKMGQRKFLSDCDIILAKLNVVIQNWVGEAYGNYFGKDPDDVKLREVIEDILNENNLDIEMKSSKVLTLTS